MSGNTSYVLPFMLASLLHGVVVTALVVKWPDESFETITSDEFLFLDAMLVEKNPYREKERQRDNVNKKTIAKKALEAVIPDPVENKDEKDQAQIDAERLAMEEDLARELARSQQLERERLERRKNEQSLSLAILDEQEYRRAITDDEKAQAYVAQITREIIKNWSRPPSARNGMEAILKVFLAPTGEVVSVSVLASSGSESFDRSAALAVQKAERFLVPTDARQFERNFREFTVLFRPEDLRL
ncbi:MAG: cell envelope integrity protein TolA [Pseudomonadales bacterium]|jgi:colicin import membrane protein|nr:cell envelope integrity protein TolA [Pseudomonadales bacterium]MDP7145266.1 cell envelope integrity protein TolA [Pseudomonadales bacterium]MDP7358358.1 cell envelope integrity protein TolA [Pseudomonadales bacterium]MDP7596872.1 cell envelope integrity protein TolA [Pseudomonadales bacterium]HJN51550.1 cell envelope integrity protein TolA [Pseudomonadales bacterium]|tara:strand:+ start:1724 stop:2455 length:732 start_codon:yes stop_codon:yes gene_type:complete